MFKERRKQVLDTLPNNAIALVYSGQAPYKVGDEKYPFAVNRNFYYLTGIDREDMMLVLVKCAGMQRELLYLERYDEQLAKWVQARMLPKQATAISGIVNVQYIDEMRDDIGAWLNRMQTEDVTIWSDFTKQEYAQSNSPVENFMIKCREKYPWVTVKNLSGILTAMRMKKGEDEVAEIKEGIRVTNLGIQAMMSHVKEGMNEAEVQAHFEFTLMKHHRPNSFPSIVASGKHGTVLHYGENNDEIGKDALVLVDLGAESRHYCADISRTFPASGTFTKRQREIYDIVLACNKHIISYAKCGMTLRQLNNETIRFYEEALKPTGLLDHGRRVSDYYWHGVSHMLGLETHDVCLLDYVLEPGNVFTVEPGLYIEDEAIGIRIEDDVLMTENGCVNLSEEIIKEPDAIEAFMKENRD